MPRPRPLPDLTGIDLAELQIAVLSILDAHHMGAEFRRRMGDTAQLGACLEAAGGARQVLAEALVTLRQAQRAGVDRA